MIPVATIPQPMLEYIIILFIVSGILIALCHNYEARRKRREMNNRYGGTLTKNDNPLNDEMKSGP